MKFSRLATYLEKLEGTASRNEITKILSELVSEAKPDDVAEISYLLLGELVPSYRGIEFNLAEKTMVQVLAAAYEEKPEAILRKFKSSGDLGNVARELASHKRHARKDPSVKDVYGALLDAARESGEGSQERKRAILAELFRSLDPKSAKFVARIPLGKLRLGFSDATLLDALSIAARGDKSARPVIEGGYNVTADIGAIAEAVKRGGVKGVSHMKPRPGVPIRPSLAERMGTIEEVMKKLGPRVGVEQKLDGFRTQIHVWQEGNKKDAVLFSRNLENTTAMFPEITEAALDLPVKSVILDGEAIGYDRKSGKFSAFQETVQRKRKYDIALFAKKIPLSVFVFDILYLDGKPLHDAAFHERRGMLECLFTKQKPGVIRLTNHKVTDDPEVVASEFKKALGANLEGLVVKNLSLPYQAGSRGFHWVKLKATTGSLENIRGGAKKGGTQLLDTVDCVVMGAYKGRGKRAQFGIGGFLLGVRGPDGRYYSISRLGTGLSDEQFREAKKKSEEIGRKEMPKEYAVDKENTPDIWLAPRLVAEILADEITRSPRHTAGRGRDARGYSLRFPRLVRFRDDKNAQDATTVEEIKRLYQTQKR